ncbi:hypothetical protein ACCS93_33505 [Rhizobium ruizarguesonis]
MERGPGKRKADASTLDGPVPAQRPIKRLKSSASGPEKSIRESIERDPDTEWREDVFYDADGDDGDDDDEREVTWSPSPRPQAAAARQMSGSGSPSGRAGDHAEKPPARAPFVPLPARQRTPVNTVNNYYGGSAPDPNAGQAKSKRAKSKGKKKQSGPRRTLHNYYDGSDDGVVLIADEEQLLKVARLGLDAKEVTLRTFAQFERHFGRSPTSADMDNTCTMTSFEPGILRSKPRHWKMIEVEKQDDWRAEYQERDSKFADLMRGVGQSDKPFRERIVTGLLSEEMGKFQTPAGERRRNHAYIQALIAGQYNPDALIRLEDGSYKAIYLKLYEGTRDLASFEAMTDKYGKTNVWLRTADFDYMTHDQFDRYGSTFDAAEKTFCEHTARPYKPNVFVRSDNGRWISKEKYDKENEFNFDEDLTKIEVLVLGDHNQGFLQPKTLKWLNPALYEQRMRAAHLTGEVRGSAISEMLANRDNRSSAPILIQISKDELLSADTIPAGVEHYRIYPQNVSEKAGYTGNYTRNWRSIRREEKFREAANDRQDAHADAAPRRPKRLVTDEQRRALKTPSPSPAPSDISDDGEFVQESSLPPDTSDDETHPSPVPRRRQLSSMPPDTSDDEMATFSRRLERQTTARLAGRSPRSSVSRQSSPLNSAADEPWQAGGNPVLGEQLGQAPEFPWPSDSSDGELPIAVQRAPIPLAGGNQAERSVRSGMSDEAISGSVSPSSSRNDHGHRSRSASRD